MHEKLSKFVDSQIKLELDEKQQALSTSGSAEDIKNKIKPGWKK